MSVRPKDLEESPQGRPLVLHCYECVTSVLATRDTFDWMFPHDPIVCEACGNELMLPSPDSKRLD